MVGWVSSPTWLSKETTATGSVADMTTPKAMQRYQSCGAQGDGGRLSLGFTANGILHRVRHRSKGQISGTLTLWHTCRHLSAIRVPGLTGYLPSMFGSNGCHPVIRQDEASDAGEESRPDDDTRHRETMCCRSSCQPGHLGEGLLAPERGVGPGACAGVHRSGNHQCSNGVRSGEE